ncbi:MAG: hypothetical protein KJN81_08445 [Acidimicrobiia bacterium]|nr:hypothetical protein [Acidimicrobiia bacterium]
MRDRFRCVALDYPGFGLSIHPVSYGYSAEEHAGHYIQEDAPDAIIEAIANAYAP